MSINSKFKHVYDGVNFKTPMQKMLEEQAKKKKALEAKTKKEEIKDERPTTKSSNRGTKSTDESE